MAIGALWTAPGLAATTISTVAGGGSQTGDGAYAPDASLSFPIGVRPVSGGFLVAEQSRYRVRKVTIDDVLTSDTGRIGTIAGTGSSGNGQPVLDGAATSVPLNLPCCLSMTAAGDLLVADTLGGMVWRVSGTRISTVAGMGSPSSCQPTPPSEIGARSAQLCFVVGVGASPSASRFLIAEDGLPDQDRTGGARVYEVDAAGAIHIVAGGGCPSPVPSAGPLGICLANPRAPTYTGSAVNPTEFVVADRGRNVVWKISSTSPASASATAIAGTGAATAADGENLGDGGPAGQATLSAPSDLALTPDGGLLIADRNNCRVRRMSGRAATSTIDTVAGAGCRPGGSAGDGGPTTEATLVYPQGVSDSPGGILVTESAGGRVRLVQRTSITSGPGDAVAGRDASFTFDSSEASPAFRCSLDGVSPMACESPQAYAGLADGVHHFSVYDSAPPPDPSPARRTWLVDTRAPEPFELSAPADGASDLPPQPVFRWREAADATSGVDHYEVVVDHVTAARVDATSCTDGVCEWRPALPLAEAPHEWQVRAVDRLGHGRDSEVRTMAVGSPPVARFTAAPDPVLIDRPVTFDASDSADAGGPIARYEWDMDGDGVYEVDAGSQAVVMRAFPQAGVVHVALRVTDSVGRTDVVSHSVRVTQPQSVPRQYGVTIDGGAGYTNDPVVTLDLRYPPSTTGVLFSNDGGFLTALALEPSQKHTWRLASSGPERLPKTVYVRFLSGPFASQTYTDDIVLDETRPAVTAASVRAVRAAAPQTGGAAATTSPAQLLRVRARDRTSGVDAMQVAAGKPRTAARFVRFRRSLDVSRLQGPLWVRVRDRAGNVSRWRRAVR